MRCEQAGYARGGGASWDKHHGAHMRDLSKIPSLCGDRDTLLSTVCMCGAQRVHVCSANSVPVWHDNGKHAKGEHRVLLG